MRPEVGVPVPSGKQDPNLQRVPVRPGVGVPVGSWDHGRVLRGHMEERKDNICMAGECSLGEWKTAKTKHPKLRPYQDPKLRPYHACLQNADSAAIC